MTAPIVNPARGHRQLTIGLWILSATFIVYGSTIPFHFTADRRVVLEHLSRATWSPLVSPDTGGFVSVPDVIQNVMLFVPFGFFGCLAIGGRSRAQTSAIIRVTGLAVLLALGIEILQLFTTRRTTAMSDLLANTGGGLVGALATERGLALWQRSIGHAKGFINTPSFYPLLIATIALCLAAWEPFDVTLELVNLRAKTEALSGDLWQFGLPRDEGVELVRYALFTAVASWWLSEIGERTPRLLAGFVGLLLAIGLEASQVWVQARMPGLEDIFLHTAGVLVGAAAGWLTRWIRSLWFWCVVVTIATVLGSSLEALGPLFFEKGWTISSWLPYFNQYPHGTFEAPSHIMELMLTYSPVGYFLALVLERPSQPSDLQRAAVVAVVGVLICAGAIEYLQQWALDRAPHLSHLPAAAAGAWMGVWAATKGRVLFYRQIAAVG